MRVTDFDRMQKKDGIRFHRGLPDLSHLTKWFGPARGDVLVLDDLMEEREQDKRVLDLFTKDSHQRNITVLYLTQDLFPPGKFSKTINRNAHYIVAFKNPRDQTGIWTILLQAFPDRWRQVLRLFKRVTSRPFGYLMLDVHPAPGDRYRLLSHLTPREGQAQSPYLARGCPCRSKTRCNENANVNAGKEKADNTLTYRPAWTPRPSRQPAWAPTPPAPPPLDLRSMTDMVTELTRPVDRAQLDQEIEDFHLSYPVNVDDAVNLFSLPPVAGTGTAPATTQPVTTATQTRPVTSTRIRPVTTTTSRPRPVTSTRTRPVTTATTTTAPTRPLSARRLAGAGTTTTTSTVTTPGGRPRIAAKQPRRRPRVPSPLFPDSSPPSSDDDGDDDNDDRRTPTVGFAE